MVSARAYRKILDGDLALGREFCFGGALLAPRPAADAAVLPEAAA
jgi:hypothetical protein